MYTRDRSALRSCPGGILSILIAGVLPGACTQDPGGGGTSLTAAEESGATSSSSSASETGTNSNSASENTSEDTAGATTLDDGSTTGTESEGGPILDVGGEPLMGCEKVDFLFVIDNSVSMASHQEALISSFPGFIDAIKSTLQATSDYHVMVVDTDAETRCTPLGCMNPDIWVDCLCIGPENGDACTSEYSTCDSQLGAGVLESRGRNASNQLCDVQGGGRYMTIDEPDLLAAFSCVAKVGEAGDKAERPMEAMMAAVSDSLNDPGGCNEGFLREDAILVITIISDDPNYEDAGTPDMWRDAVVAAKGGDEEAIVVLGLLPKFEVCDVADIDLCGDVLTPMPNPLSGLHWVEFVESFGDQSLWEIVCLENYTPFFEEAVAIVDQVCDSFIPPG